MNDHGSIVILHVGEHNVSQYQYDEERVSGSSDVQRRLDQFADTAHNFSREHCASGVPMGEETNQQPQQGEETHGD